MTTSEIIAAIHESEKDLELLRAEVTKAKMVLREKESAQRVALREKYAIIQMLDKDSPFQVGEKVNVSKAILKGSAFYGNWIDAQGFVSSIRCWLRKDESVEYEYKVKKIKKDGTMSEKYLRYKNDNYIASQLTKIK